MTLCRALPLLVAAALALPAHAADLFGGLYKHGVNTPLSIDVGQRGVDFELGYRANSILPLGPLAALQPYAFASLNSTGDASLAAGGLSLKIGGPIYVRPGVGVAVHTGKSRSYDAAGDRTDLGSRVLFEPELGIGFVLAPRLSLEASWVHVSHAQLFSHQNPGLDMIGARINLHLP